MDFAAPPILEWNNSVSFQILISVTRCHISIDRERSIELNSTLYINE